MSNSSAQKKDKQGHPAFDEAEQARLQALIDYKILDTEPELDFESITELASEIAQTPIALISLVDKDRQWFKSKFGIEVDETPREIAFCDHAIRTDEVMIVPDAELDLRFTKNPLVTDDPHVRFYAGAPLKTPEGHRIGTLCVIDTEPKQFTELQSKALKTLADQVIKHLELRKKNLELASKMQELQEALKLVQTQQEALIESEKTALFGRMAGGLGHELNNPLQILRSSIDLLRHLEEKSPQGVSSDKKRISWTKLIIQPIE